jgi:hypothetical protein
MFSTYIFEAWTGTVMKMRLIVVIVTANASSITSVRQKTKHKYLFLYALPFWSWLLLFFIDNWQLFRVQLKIHLLHIYYRDELCLGRKFSCENRMLQKCFLAKKVAQYYSCLWYEGTRGFQSVRLHEKLLVTVLAHLKVCWVLNSLCSGSVIFYCCLVSCGNVSVWG